MAKSCLLKIIPSVSMFDVSVRILASGLSAGQRIILSCNVTEAGTGVNFETEAHYVANEIGQVDCEKLAAVGGAYKGVHPMGLFWSLKLASNQKPGAKLLPIKATQPLKYNLTIKDPLNRNQILSQINYDRYFLHPQVKRYEINEGRVRGTLFVPINDADQQKLPAIIDLYGTRGGLNEIRASLLASHGFVTLALAYFNYKDLPNNFDELELEYFDEAIKFLLNHPSVMDNGVGVIGTSYGAELALIMASYLPQVKAVVSINGLHLLDEFNPIKYKGITLPTVAGDASTLDVIDGCLRYLTYRSQLPNDPQSIFPIERSRAQFLFLASEDDQATPAVQSARHLMETLNKNGKKNQGDLLTLPNAGHVLEPPYTPHTAMLFHKVVGAQMIFGGEPTAHAEAQELAWQKIRLFFTKYLGEPIQLKPLREIIGKSKL